jgi:hypothetical protein
MSIHGICFDNGMSGRCDIWECDKFNEGRCDRALEIFNLSLENCDECDECNIDEYGCIDMDIIYVKYPELIKGKNKPNKESIMDKNQTKLEVQRVDREKAGNKVEALIKGLSTHATSEFFNGESEEIFNETIQVPVKVSCFEQSGTRKVYINAFGADGAKLNVVVSKELIECLQGLKAAVDMRDAALGCENLNDLASKL